MEADQAVPQKIIQFMMQNLQQEQIITGSGRLIWMELPGTHQQLPINLPLLAQMFQYWLILLIQASPSIYSAKATRFLTAGCLTTAANWLIASN